jgi:hypothetical protein
LLWLHVTAERARIRMQQRLGQCGSEGRGPGRKELAKDATGSHTHPGVREEEKALTDGGETLLRMQPSVQTACQTHTHTRARESKVIHTERKADKTKSPAHPADH